MTNENCDPFKENQPYYCVVSTLLSILICHDGICLYFLHKIDKP